MLRWIKLWDKVVFNRKPKIKPIKSVDEKFNVNNQKRFFKPQFELDTDLDEHGRPKYKVALLCGPPGLGKDYFLLFSMNKTLFSKNYKQINF